MEYKTVTYDTICEGDFDGLNIKVVIFDFDYTLYQGLEWGNDWIEYVYSGLRRMLSFLTADEYERLCKKYDIKSDRIFENVCKMLKNENLPCTIKEFRDFTQTFRFETDYRKARLFPRDLLEKLKKKYALYVVSSTAESKIRFDCEKMNFDLSPFKGVYQNRFDENDLSKALDYKMVAKKENVKNSEVLVVGDSVQYDLEPARRLGMQTLLMLNV